MKTAFLVPQAGGGAGGGGSGSNATNGTYVDQVFTQDEATPATGVLYTIATIGRSYTANEITAVTRSGTCTIQMYVNGVAVPSSNNAASSTNNTFTSITKSLVRGDLLQYQVLSSPAPSTPNDITVTVNATRMATAGALTAGTASTTGTTSSTASVASTAASGGTAPYTNQWQRSLAVGSGFANVSGATSLTLNDSGLSASTNYYYRNVFTDSFGATATSNVTTATTASGALSAGTASTGSTGATTATVLVTNATGGTSPYTYQWYRSTTSGFTPGAGNIVSGATSQTLNDTGLTASTTYYYVNKVTDAASNTANSNQISATTSSGGGSPGALQFNNKNNSALIGA